MFLDVEGQCVTSGFSKGRSEAGQGGPSGTGPILLAVRSGTGPILLSQATFLLAHIAKAVRSGTGPILLSQATFLLAHIANSGPVPLSASGCLAPESP